VSAVAIRITGAAWNGLAALAAAGAAAIASPADARAEGALLAGLLAWAGLIDARRFVLPDVLTGLIAASGLVAALLQDRALLAERVLGAIVGYAAFVAISVAYRRARGRDGLGLGDAKLFAGAGAWLGWAGLPWVSLLAAATGLMHFAILTASGRARDTATPIPFGPHLCVAIWVVWRFAPAP
jgi:leader peptidase (prepilin peptidase)/N-methyltransferase